MKKGRTADYVGGSVWKTQGDALRNCPEGYAVFAVVADWDKDTVPSKDGNWHDLLIDSNLIKLDYGHDNVGIRKQEAQGLRTGAGLELTGVTGDVA